MPAIINLPKKVPLTFLLLLIVSLFFHEFWHDEVQAWLIAKNTNSLIELSSVLKYDGHPPLWHWLLRVPSKLGFPLWSMKVLHLIIATISFVLLIDILKPLKKALWLLPFNYYLIFEYGAISRNYTLGLLGFFLFVYSIQNKKSLFYFCFAFFLMFFSNAYAYFLGLTVLIWSTFFIEDKKQKYSISLIGFIMASIIAYHNWPPLDTSFAPMRNTNFSFSGIFSFFSPLTHALFPIFLPGKQFWNTHALSYMPFLKSLMGWFLFLILSFFFKKNRKVFFLWLLGNLLLGAFYYYRPFIFTRHIGHLFILFLGCLSLTSMSHHLKKISFGILFVQLILGTYALTMDITFPFSNIKSAGEYLKKNYPLKKTQIFIDQEAYMSALTGFWKEDVYFLSMKKWGSYVLYDNNWKEGRIRLSQNSLMVSQRVSGLKLLTEAPFKEDQTNLFVTNYAIPSSLQNQYQLKLKKDWKEALIPGENVYIYHILKANK